ncbi:MAG: sn-glycerol-3-phosphate ABC transporter substrate-binding protein UgpB [Neisseriaceae bacterium]
MLKNELWWGLVFCASLLGLSACQEKAPPDNEIVFWHSLSGNLENELNSLIADFNKAHPELKVKGVNKGSYAETLNAGIAAFRSHTAPDILQVYEVGTATMMSSGDIIKPVYSLMKEAGVPLDRTKFVDAVAAYYADSQGQLVSLPFNSSTPIFYYNKDAFKKAGLDPDRPPKSFEEVKAVAKQLVGNKVSGVSCGLTVTWPGWILIENGAARNNAEYATKNNGFGGLDARIRLQQPYYKRILNDLSEMVSDRSFVYGGRGDKPNELFTTGQCAMLLDSSGNYSDIKSNSKFEFAVAPMPYYASLPGTPQNSIIGGASLWVFSGKSAQKYKGIATFLNYMSSPEVVSRWHQKTGYVPVTKEGYELTRKAGYYKLHPEAEVAIKQLNSGLSSVKRGIRLGNLPAIRDIDDQELERGFSHQIPLEEVLKNIETLSNKKLQEFQKNHRLRVDK